MRPFWSCKSPASGAYMRSLDVGKCGYFGLMCLFWCHNTFGLSCMGFLSDGAAPGEGPVGWTDVKIFDAGFDVDFVAVIA